ncbi:hypothetical protein MFAL_00110 [Mycolicibacterium fallax]|nr:hypothetical protein MFAL_00110 [Mycolicibacterium fallax]
MPVELLTEDVEALVARDDVDIVVELMGPVEPARRAILAALEHGKSVVTANKALLAQSTGKLATAAEKARVDLYFEAAVAGAIPVIRPLTQSLAGDRVLRVAGIVNGTTNYILSAMSETGASYDDALAEAGALATPRPTRPPTSRAMTPRPRPRSWRPSRFTPVQADDVYREGITAVSAEDFASAKALGCTIKLLSICERITNADGSEQVSARVYPALVPLTHPLASVNGAFNAVFVEAAAAGQLMFYGQGAGGAPTASAVLGDVVMAARNRVQGGRGPRESKYARLPIAPIGVVPTRYYLSLYVHDKPGVLSKVASEFANRGVSIAEVRQEGLVDEDGQPIGARIVVLTHRATDAALSETVTALKELDVVSSVASVLHGRNRVMNAPVHRPWPGLIEAYRHRLPDAANWTAVTLLEGGTPLIHAKRISEMTGCTVHLKVEGLNPTGSFKDRGMTMAVTDAVERGQQAVLCASTGNTSASAAAYAARAGITCAVLIPQGKIAMGKLAQAVMHGAKIIQIDGNFDDCLELARKLTADYPTISLVNSVNPVRIEGQKTAAFEIVDALGRAPDVHSLPVGNAGNITAYWKGYNEYHRDGLAETLPRMLGTQAAGAAPLVLGHPVSDRRPSPPRSGSARRPRGTPRSPRARSPTAGSWPPPTRRSWRPTAWSPAPRECSSSRRRRPALPGCSSPLPTAGCRGSSVVCTVTGNGLKDPDTALRDIPEVKAVPVDPSAVVAELGWASAHRDGRSDSSRRAQRSRRRLRFQCQPRPRLRQHGPGAGDL